MAFSRVLNLGKSSGGSQLHVTGYGGRSLDKGDDVDYEGLANTTSGTQYIRQTAEPFYLGYSPIISAINTKGRACLMVKIPLKDNLPAFSRVLGAVLYFYFTRGTWPSGTVPSASQNYKLYGVRRPGFDYSTFTAKIYKTALNWDEYLLKVGTDVTAVEIANFNFTQTMYDLGGSDQSVQIAVSNEIQYHADRNEDCYIIIVPNFSTGDPDSGATGNIMHINPRGPQDNPSSAHTYLQVNYVPALVFHGSTNAAGRPVDFSSVLDPASFESQYHLYMGFIGAGLTGDAKKYFIRNTRNDRQSGNIVVEGARSRATQPVTNPANSTAKALRSVDVFDLTLNVSAEVTALTPRGAWEIRATSSTLYDVYFQANFTGSFVSVASGKAFASDETIVDTAPTPDRNILAIRSGKWSAGSPASGDKWSFETSPDRTDPAYKTDSMAMMQLIPHADGNQDTADTARARKLNAATQVLRGSVYTWNDAGTDRSVIPILDTLQYDFEVGQHCEVFDGVNSEHGVIHAIKALADVLPGSPPGGLGNGDAIILEDELTNAYAAGAYFTTGLLIAPLVKASDTFVNTAGALANGSNVRIPITAAVDWTPGTTFVAISLLTGASNTYVVQTNGGTYIDATTPIAAALVSGDLVLKSDAGNAESLFVRGTVPGGSSLGDRFAYVDAYEVAPTLQHLL